MSNWKDRYVTEAEVILSYYNMQISSINFRANIVVDQCQAWDEDKWAEIRIGDTHLECFAPCTRYAMLKLGIISACQSFSLHATDFVPLSVFRERMNIFQMHSPYSWSRDRSKGRWYATTEEAKRVSSKSRERWSNRRCSDSALPLRERWERPMDNRLFSEWMQVGISVSHVKCHSWLLAQWFIMRYLSRHCKSRLHSSWSDCLRQVQTIRLLRDYQYSQMNHYFVHYLNYYFSDESYSLKVFQQQYMMIYCVNLW